MRLLSLIRRPRLITILLFGTFLLLSLSAVLALWAGSEIASPPRRPLMDYHQLILSDQATHGIRIDRFTTSDGTPCLIVTPAGKPGKRGSTLRTQLTNKNLTLPAFGTITGTLVLTHGRKSRKEDYLSIAERFSAVGFRCIIPDLPAHGDHPTETATFGLREASLPALVLRESSRHFNFNPYPAGLMGMSMGGSVAIHAAGQPDAPWQSLIVIASFDSLASTIENQASRYIGHTLGPVWAHASGSVFQYKTGHSLGDVEPHRIAATLTIPTLIAHGTADAVIPLASGKRLFNSLPSATTKQWIEIPKTGHDNVLVTDYPIYATMAEWMITHVH